MLKRYRAILLILVIALLGAVLGLVIVANASSHSHGECGITGCAHPSVEFEPYNESEGGNFYLEADCDQFLEITSDTVICLNGNKILSKISVLSGTLTLCDCVGGGEVYVADEMAAIMRAITVAEGACLNVHNIDIYAEGATNVTAIYADPDAAVNLYGARITVESAQGGEVLESAGEGTFNPYPVCTPIESSTDSERSETTSETSDTQSDTSDAAESVGGQESESGEMTAENTEVSPSEEIDTAAALATEQDSSVEQISETDASSDDGAKSPVGAIIAISVSAVVILGGAVTVVILKKKKIIFPN